MTRFDTTRWSMVLRARDGSGQARGALETLCRTYRPPVLAYIKRRGYSVETAEDLTQTFFGHFLERAYHADADQTRGRFRAFLLTALKRFLIDAEHQAHAVKRGGRVHFKSSDHDITHAEELENLADGQTPESAFECSWAATLLESALSRLREEAANAGKQALFEQLSEFLTERPDDADYARVAAALNLRRNTLAVAVHRLRHRLRELIREELAQTTIDPAGLESEFRDMRTALGTAIA
jgi:RNA polymerase sigma factor (sigma-70 family)